VKRRQLVMLGAAMVFVAPLPLRAQGKRTARIGVLDNSGRGAEFNAMFKSLGELGWVEGRNLTIEFSTLDPELTGNSALVLELVRLKCELIVAQGTRAAMAVKEAAPSMPMVFIVPADPVALGLVTSLARPGGNATGLSFMSPGSSVKQLALLKEIAPKAKRVAVMFEADHPSSLQSLRAVQAAAGTAGLMVQPMPLRGWKDVDNAYLALKSEPVDGLIVLFDRITAAYSVNIVSVADRLRLPVIYGARHFIDDGGIVSYGIDWAAAVLRSAGYVARILDGEKPANLPVQQPTQFQLVVNKHMARVRGVTIPQSVLLQATEVIE
jgi:putative ABC transport system substrate-binding protein